MLSFHFSVWNGIEMALHVLFILLAFQTVLGNEDNRQEGFINKLGNGMKFAQNFLGKFYYLFLFYSEYHRIYNIFNVSLIQYK